MTQLTKITVGGEDIIATPNHPFYCTDKGWIAAVDMKAGYMLRCPGGELVSVEGVMHTNFDEPVKVYNFQVEDFHTYYVGRVGVLVHNADYKNQTNEQLLKSKKSYEDLIAEHEGKLKDYIEDPDAYDNQGRLVDAPNTQVRESIINGRIKNLQGQINKQNGELEKILSELKIRG